MGTLQKLQSQTPKTAAALAEAATRASDFLELSKVEFSEIVGMSSPQVTRLWKGVPILSESKKVSGNAPFCFTVSIGLSLL